MRFVHALTIRIIICAVIVAAMFWAIIGSYAPFLREQQIARRVQFAGGKVDFNHFQFVLGARKIRVSVFDRISGVTLEGLKVPADLRSELGSLPELTHLDLSNTDVEDSDLKYLARLRNLKRLELRNTQITDAGLKDLDTLRELMYLDLGNTRITDAGFDDLAKLTGLTTLDISSTNVTGAGLQQLVSLTMLQFLRLNNTQITDRDIEPLINLTALTELDVRRAQTTNAGRAKIGSTLRRCKILPYP